MDLPPTRAQIQILEAARKALAQAAPMDRFSGINALLGRRDSRLWPELGELGFLTLGLPTALGGAGLGLTEEALLYRELGRRLISPAVLGLTLAARMAAHTDDALMLEALSSGEARVAIGVPHDPQGLGEFTSGRFNLIETDEAAWTIAWSPAGAGLFRTGDFIDLAPIVGVDDLLHIERGRLDHAQAVVWLDAKDDPIAARANTLIAAYAVGVCEANRDMATEDAQAHPHAGGSPATFLAIQGSCADMAVIAGAAWRQTVFAVVAASTDGEDRDFETMAAAVLATDAARRNADQAIAVHAALDLVSPCDARLHQARARVLMMLTGDLDQTRSAEGGPGRAPLARTGT